MRIAYLQSILKHLNLIPTVLIYEFSQISLKNVKHFKCVQLPLSSPTYTIFIVLSITITYLQIILMHLNIIPYFVPKNVPIHS